MKVPLRETPLIRKSHSEPARSGWEEVEHESDIALRVEAGNETELFLNAANGMIELIIDPSTVVSRTARTVTALGEDPEGLLVGWLEEILCLFEVDSFAPARAEDLQFENGRLSGTVKGEVLNPDIHEIRYVIKAVTWHDLKIIEEKGVYRVKVVFDV